MDRTMSANLAAIGAAMAMMGVTMASRKLGLSHGEMLPKQTVERALDVTGLEQEVSEPQEKMLGMGAHMGFSMSSAMLYAQVRKHVEIPGPLAGALFGLGIWGINLAGIAPMLGIRATPWKQDEGKAMTTIVAHIVFGVVLGVLYDALVSEGDA